MSVGETRWHALLDQLHASPIQIALVMAGGGSGALAHCFRRPGASSTFVEAVIPYSRRSMAEYLELPQDVRPDVSIETAQRLAERAFHRAARFCESENQHSAAGISLTAALPTSEPRRGLDRIHVALQDDARRSHWSVDLGQADVTRSFAETVSDELLFKALACYAPGRDNQSFFDDAGIEVRTDRPG